MRKLLLSAAAGAPLLLLAAGPALADTTVGSTNNPVQTSTANNGQPDNVIVGSGSTVNVSGPVAVTQDSSNTVTNNGTITINNQDNSTAVHLTGGYTGSLINNGTISVTESYTRSDTNNDGILDGDFAQGTGRYGVHLTGASPLVGSITSNVSTTISVQGKNSFGIALDAPLTGDVTLGGTTSVVGEGSTAFSETGGISGKVLVTGVISATGGPSSPTTPGSVGASFQGNVGGSIGIYSSIVSTGYSTTARNPDPAINNGLVASDLTQSGSAVQIGADVKGGVFIGSPPAGTSATDTTTDADGDGIVDSVEGTGSIATYGTAPALAIGSGSRDVHLSPYGAGSNAYGLIIEGAVTGNGVFDNHSGTGMQIGGSGGYKVTVDGIHITSTGAVTGQGYEDNGTAIHLLSGATVSTLQNDGEISGALTASTATGKQATGILIDAGASLPSLVNNGGIGGAITGDNGAAAAIVDNSGTLSSIVNTNTITSSITPLIDSDTVTGSTTALDLRANTTGVTLTQNANSSTSVTPKITGDILLGSGDDTVAFNAGTVAGTLDFGKGSGSLTIDGGASYTGQLLATGSTGSLAINVKNGSLEDDSPTELKLSSLNVGATGKLTVSVDPINNTATYFNVSGQANMADGAGLSVKLLSLINGVSQSYTVVSAAGGLTVGNTSTLTANTPFLFVAQFTPDTTDGTITLDLRRRTAAEAGLELNKAETVAWDPVYNNLALNSGIERAFLAQTDAAGYRSMLNQLLPDYAGGLFRALSWASEQQGIAAGDPPVGEDQQGPTRAWTQEIVLDETKNTAQTEPYNILGVGVVAGLESVSPKGTALGMKIGFTTANIKNPTAPGDNLLGVSEINGGVYWRGGVGPLRADAQLGAGFIWANDRREFLYTDDIGTVHQVAMSDWTGYTLSARAGLSYTANLGSFFLEPRVHADYFRLHQTGYSEHGGGTGFDMQVDARNGDIFTVTGSVLAGMTFGTTGFRWRPQIEAGYRAVISGDAGSTTTQFIGGTDAFTLAAETVKLNSAIGRAGLRIYSDYLDLLLDAGIAYNKDYTDVDVHLTARTVF